MVGLLYGLIRRNTVRVPAFSVRCENKYREVEESLK